MTTAEKVTSWGVVLTCLLTFPILGAVMFGVVGGVIGLVIGLMASSKSIQKLAPAK